VTEEKVRTEAPRQAQREDPDRREPHARVIVQVARRDEFPGPSVETVESGLAGFGASDSAAQPGIAVPQCDVREQSVAVAFPDLWAVLHPALEVAAPEDLLHELGGRRGPVCSDRRIDHLGFGQEPAADPR
jgi:hypothetical protein